MKHISYTSDTYMHIHVTFVLLPLADSNDNRMNGRQNEWSGVNYGVFGNGTGFFFFSSDWSNKLIFIKDC